MWPDQLNKPKQQVYVCMCVDPYDRCPIPFTSTKKQRDLPLANK